MRLPVALALSVSIALSAAAREAVITLQVRPDVKLDTLRKIAKLAEPRTRTLDRDLWAYEILREEYGSSHAKLRILFADYNGLRQRFRKGETVVLPPAPAWLFDVKERVNASASLKSYVEAKLGIAGPKNLQSIAEKSNLPPAAVKKLKPGAQVVLPYVAKPVSLEVDEAKLPQIEKQIAELKRTDDAIHVLDLAPELRLTPHVSSFNFGCVFTPVAAQTHCNVEHLERFPKKERTVVAVLDSGIPAGDTRFQFWQNPGEAGKRAGVDDDGNYYVDDIIGTNFLSGGGYPIDDDVPVESHRSHGTHVAGLASCRLSGPQHQALINERVELMILKVASADGSVTPAAVMNAIAYAMEYNAHIVNLSIEGATFDIAVRKLMKSGDKMLFIAAAGNGVDSIGQDLNGYDVFPAKLSKDLPNVMSVAAHDGDDNLTCFSNYGGDIVDIAAPGLDVQSTVFDGSGAYSGTSQAAPLVTLGAALLHASGLDDPVKIRERLVLAADFKPSLRGKVRSEGTLNIGKALAYDADLVVTKSATYEGALTGFTGVADVPADSIRKVINGYDSNPARQVKIVTASEPKYAATMPNVTIRTREGQNVSVAAADVVEIIPHLR